MLHYVLSRNCMICPLRVFSFNCPEGRNLKHCVVLTSNEGVSSYGLNRNYEVTCFLPREVLLLMLRFGFKLFSPLSALCVKARSIAESSSKFFGVIFFNLLTLLG